MGFDFINVRLFTEECPEGFHFVRTYLFFVGLLNHIYTVNYSIHTGSKPFLVYPPAVIVSQFDFLHSTGQSLFLFPAVPIAIRSAGNKNVAALAANPSN